jgi:threonine synthase
MISVQATGCAPIVKAWDEGKHASEMWANAATSAAGLRVPKAYGDYLILDILRKSKGTAVAVSDEEIMDALRHWARVEGVFAAPEGATALAAYRKLRSSQFFKESDRVVLFNTGTGLKYLDTLEIKRVERAGLPTGRQIAGIIGPY